MEGPDPKKHWAEALAAVIPGEALAAHATIISFFTVKGADGAAASLTNAPWVQRLSVGVMLLIPIVYAASSGNLLARKHVLRWVVAMVAFAAWLWLLPLSVWDTFVRWDNNIRAGLGVLAAVLIVSAANYLFKKYPLP
jgi:hypothetical protein